MKIKDVNKMNERSLSKYILLGTANGVFSLSLLVLLEMAFQWLDSIWGSLNRTVATAVEISQGTNCGITEIQSAKNIIFGFVLLLFLFVLATIFTKYTVGRKIKSEAIFWQVVGMFFVVVINLSHIYQTFNYIYELISQFDLEVLQNNLIYLQHYQTPRIIIEMIFINLGFVFLLNRFRKFRIR